MWNEDELYVARREIVTQKYVRLEYSNNAHAFGVLLWSFVFFVLSSMNIVIGRE